MEEEKRYLTKREKYGFGFAAAGQGAMYAMMSSWIGRFYTDVMGLELLFVMGLMWGTRLISAISDPLMGVLVDKTRTRYGKMRPYLMFTPLIVALFSVLIFLDLGFSKWGKIIYVTLTYVLWNVAYTASDVPFWGLPCAMTPNAKERDSFFSFARTLNGVGGALPVVLVALLISDSVLGLSRGITVSAIIFAVLGVIPFEMTFFFTRERIEPAGEVLTVKQMASYTKKNRLLLLVVLFGLLGFGKYMLQAGYSYAADYVFRFDMLPDIFYEQRQLVGMALIGVGMFPAMLLMPMLMRKFDYRTLVVGAGLFSALVMGLFYLFGIVTHYSFAVALPFLFLGGMPLGIFNIIIFALLGDCVDYMEYKFGVRQEGIALSCQTFVNKFGAAFSAGLIPLLLKVSGYITPVTQDGVTVLPIQPASAKSAIFAAITLVPAISLVLCVLPILKFDFVKEKKKTALEYLKQHRAIVEDGSPTSAPLVEATDGISDGEDTSQKP